MGTTQIESREMKKWPFVNIRRKKTSLLILFSLFVHGMFASFYGS